ncbi:MAG TPA: phospholipase D-like domain-containing protein [Halococcus sp.]|nr:phospholipase D-like domain-containing protein [Halococcus sp.]
MPSRAVAFAVALGIVVTLVGPVVATGGITETQPDGPHIETVYPNPLADEDRGEYVLLDFPQPTNLTGWALSDGETTISLPNTTIGGRVAITAEPNLTANHTPASVLALNESLSLANGGDEVTLLDGEHVVSETAYVDAPDAELWNRTTRGWTWEHLGATHFAPVRVDALTARAFVLPDAPEVPIEVLDSADQRILLAGYTFSSVPVAEALKRAKERGVKVRVLVDDAPVGGMSARQARVLDGLVAAGIPVSVIGGDWARYDYHHAKYAVVDDRALVMTENWKPSGTGGHSNRGWGVVVRGETADVLTKIFHADTGWRDTVSWRVYRANRTFEPDEVATETYPTNFEPQRISVESVQVLAAPDNAEAVLLRRLNRANESIDVIQAAIGSRKQPFLQASIRAAKRGVKVRILLSNAWYSEEENGALADWLNRKAEAENLPLEAKVVEPESTFGDIHAKGVIIDGESVILGSMNWNNNSARDNREVAVVLESRAAGKYYGRVFDADWKEGDGGPEIGIESPIPVGMMAAVAGVVVLAVVVARRIEFE